VSATTARTRDDVSDFVAWLVAESAELERVMDRNRGKSAGGKSSANSRSR
jgi:hypothetical protein